MNEYYSARITSVTSGRKVVAVAGTREAFAAMACRYVIISALESNTDLVVIGGPDVIASAGTRVGIQLAPQQQQRIDISNMSKLYIDSVVSGEGVCFAAFN